MVLEFIGDLFFSKKSPKIFLSTYIVFSLGLEVYSLRFKNKLKRKSNSRLSDFSNSGL